MNHDKAGGRRPAKTPPLVALREFPASETYGEPPLNPAGILFGKTRRTLLGLLFANDHLPFHVRAIIRLTGLGPGGIQRELRQLTRAGIIIRSHYDGWVFYQPNPHSPIFEQMYSIVSDTLDVTPLDEYDLVSPSRDYLAG